MLKNIVVIAFICLVLACPALAAFPFNYSVISNEEVSINHFRTVLEMNAKPSIIGVKNAIDAGKSNNIIVDSVTKDGDFYVVKGHLVNYQIQKNHLFNPWWNASWSSRKTITITTNGTSTPVWYQVKLNISYVSGMQADFDDIRFTNSSDGTLAYWIESKVNSSYANVWVNLSDAITDPGSDTLYMYYGNVAVSDGGNGNNTFELFDDFSGASLNTDKWVSSGGTAVQNSGILTYTPGADTNIQSTSNFAPGHSMRISNQISAASWSSWGLQISPYATPYQRITGYVDASNNWMVVADAAEVNIETNWITGSYTTKEIMWDDANNILKWYENNIEKTNSPYTTGANIPDESLRVVIARGTQIHYVDWILVRKYIAIEPTVSYGSLEQSLISSWGNNFTNNQNTTIQLYENKNIKFNITTRYGDPINWWADGVNQSNNYDNISVSFTSVGAHNVTAYVTNATTTQSVTWDIILNMQLITPVNTTTIYNPYPPSAPAVTFAWTSSGFPFYNLLISTDPYFNYIVASNYYSSEIVNVFLLSDTKYYWKVRTYLDALTPGEYSSTSWFNLTSNYSVSGKTGIAGTIYQKTDAGDLLPLSGAVVYIRSESLNWSSSLATGVNGYFLFDNLTNNTVYSLNAKSTGYEDSQTEYVTTVPGVQIIKNILLSKCISGFNCFYNQHYVKFTVQNIWFTKYQGVTANVYKGSELVASDTKTTGTDGSVNLLLIKDQQYRITFINSTQGISVTWTGYPSATQYFIITDATTSGWDTHGSDAAATTDISVTTSIINDTHAYVNVSYNDTLAGTSNLIFYLNQSIPGDPNNQTVLQTISGGSSSTYNASFIQSGYAGNSYIVKVKADHSTYGTISYSYAVQFGAAPGPLSNFDPTVILMLFVGFVLFISGIFGQSTNSMGAGIVCALCWILGGIGIFNPLNVGAGFWLALSLATVIVVLLNINERGKSEALP